MKRLYRSRSTRVLGGVAAGTAEYFGVDITVMRLMFALVGLVLPQAILAYILAWVIIPEEPAGYSAYDREPACRPEAPGTDRPEGPVAGEPATGSDTGGGGGLTAEEILAGADQNPRPAGAAVGSSSGRPTENSDRNRQFFGYALIGIGAVILLKRVIPSFWWRFPVRLVREWWPLGVILIGVAMILGVIRGGNRH